MRLRVNNLNVMTKKNENFDDLIFELRNQDYGAYELRKNYSKRGIVAFIISMIIIFLTTGSLFIKSISNKDLAVSNLENITVLTLEDIENTKEKDLIPVLPNFTPAPPPINVYTHTEILRIIEDKTSTDEEVVPDFVNDTDINETETEELMELELDIVTVEEEFTESPYLIADNLPQFDGGDVALKNYIAQTMIYPPEALEKKIKGKVYIRFIVNPTGLIDCVEVACGANKLLNEEAVRIVKSFPKWIPGQNNGKNVSVWWTVLIHFKLN
jgi:protein TonB